MAKKQSFADKMMKKPGAEISRAIRLVYSYKSPTGSWKFTDKILKLSADENEEQAIENEIKSGKARMENVREG